MFVRSAAVWYLLVQDGLGRTSLSFDTRFYLGGHHRKQGRIVSYASATSPFLYIPVTGAQQQQPVHRVALVYTTLSRNIITVNIRIFYRNDPYLSGQSRRGYVLVPSGKVQNDTWYSSWLRRVLGIMEIIRSSYVRRAFWLKLEAYSNVSGIIAHRWRNSYPPLIIYSGEHDRQ